MITVINLSENINKLPENVINWEAIPSNVKDHLLSGTHYRHNGQELLVYNKRQIIASCTIDLDYHDNIIINDCWTKEGNIYQ